MVGHAQVDLNDSKLIAQQKRLEGGHVETRGLQ